MRSVLLGASLVVSLFFNLPAPAETGDAQQLLTLEQRWLTAAMQRDTKTLKDILADDFVDVTYQGRVARQGGPPQVEPGAQQISRPWKNSR